MKRYKNIMVRDFVYFNFDAIEKIYRSNHPEMDGVPLSKTKLLLEMQKYYSKFYKETILIKNE